MQSIEKFEGVSGETNESDNLAKQALEAEVQGNNREL